MEITKFNMFQLEGEYPEFFKSLLTYSYDSGDKGIAETNEPIQTLMNQMQLRILKEIYRLPDEVFEAIKNDLLKIMKDIQIRRYERSLRRDEGSS